MSNSVTGERLAQMVFGFAPPLIVEAGVRTGVFEALEREPLRLAALTDAIGASRRGTEMLADALVGLGLLVRNEDDCYALTPESANFLVRSKPENFLGGLFARASTQLVPNWLHIVEAVTTGRPPMAVNREKEGAKFFATFVEALLPMGWRAAQRLTDHIAAAGPPPAKLLDIAAGSGVWTIPAAQRFAEARVVAVDWPEVLGVTRRMVDRY